jgi:hypothetical protein
MYLKKILVLFFVLILTGCNQSIPIVSIKNGGAMNYPLYLTSPLKPNANILVVSTPQTEIKLADVAINILHHKSYKTTLTETQADSLNGLFNSVLVNTVLTTDKTRHALLSLENGKVYDYILVIEQDDGLLKMFLLKGSDVSSITWRADENQNADAADSMTQDLLRVEASW